MRAQARVVVRRQLDNRLKSLVDLDIGDRPTLGWVKSIREALGMTMAQLALRLGVSAPRILKLEHAEAQGTITLKSLERAAEAMGCRLIYAIVPGKPLTEMVAERARLVARRRLGAVRHYMMLEDQAVDPVEDDVQLSDLARKLAEKAGSALWE